jgi:hypothetical protein
MLDFVVDQLYLILVAAFAVASFAIMRSRRREQRSRGTVGLAGVRTAAIASVVSVVVLALVTIVVVLTLGGLIRAATGSAYSAAAPPTIDPASQARDILFGLLWLMSIPGVTFVAVLDLYAISPPGPNDPRAAQRYAVIATLFSFLLLAGALFVPVLVDEANASAAERDAEQAFVQLRHDIEARSAGLSMVVDVVDADLGGPTQNGRIVEHLTLDITVRSATDIELRTVGDQNLRLESEGPRADGTTYGTNAVIYLDWGELPAHMPAGFNATYRLEVPIAPEDQRKTDPAATGSWKAVLGLQDRSPGPARVTSMGRLELRYETATSFIVSDTQ